MFANCQITLLHTGQFQREKADLLAQTHAVTAQHRSSAWLRLPEVLPCLSTAPQHHMPGIQANDSQTEPARVYQTLEC